MYVCVCVFVRVCVRFGGKRSVPIGREPTNRDAEFFGAVKRSLPIGRDADRRSVHIGRGNKAFRLVGNRPIGTWSSSVPSKGAFRLVGMRTDGVFILVGGTKRSNW